MPPIKFNPNKRRSKIESYLTLSEDEQKDTYPEFVTSIKIEKFRHLENLSLEFKSPITVISGSNKSGKSSVLLCLGCSHFNFMTLNSVSGKYERTRWGDVMRFTSSDVQTEDWSYEITCRVGGGLPKTHPGKRSLRTKKWSGCAKKEGQIGNPGPGRDVSPNGRFVYLMDLERIIPGRHHPSSVYSKVKGKRATNLNRLVNAYLSYILENKYTSSELGGIGERKIFSYRTNHQYTSFNSASGEDVLTHLLVDIVSAKDKSLILIEEIEIGLHPKIQKRLMDILYFESTRSKKQFIVTTHSAAILSSVQPTSRIFLYKDPTDKIVCIPEISLNGALSSMDSESYPLVSIYVEDEISQRLVQEGLELAMVDSPWIRKCVRIIPVGSADKTYNYFQSRKTLEAQDFLKRGYACVLDGDKRQEMKNGILAFPAEDLLFFHHSNEAPERMLLREFLKYNPNRTLQYHADDGNAHNLLQKIVDEGLAASPQHALAKCIECLKRNPAGIQYLEDLAKFITKCCEKFIS